MLFQDDAICWTSKGPLRNANISSDFSSGLIIAIEIEFVVILFQLMHALPGYCGWPICDPTSATDANTTEEETFLSARLSCFSF